VVLVPFLLFGDDVETYVGEVLSRPMARTLLAGFAVLALAADVLLPIPSSLVAAALGAVFGAVAGTLLSTVGLTLGCAAGFALGRFAGAHVGPRYQVLERLLDRYGTAVLVVCRGVPVLAEASVIAAGMLAMPAPRFIAATALANVAVSAVYASLGAVAAERWAAAAFVLAILLPAVLLAAVALGRKMIFVARSAPSDLK
jgi:uncharacterized membrane protein YdjX (TVP38/TMEM64 family)